VTSRTVEDRLREEYFLLSPEIRRVLHQLQTDVAYLLLPVTLGLKHHERIHVEARVKECDSAISALRRREGSSTKTRRRATRLLVFLILRQRESWSFLSPDSRMYTA
jgi:hypothetical protein